MAIGDLAPVPQTAQQQGLNVNVRTMTVSAAGMIFQGAVDKITAFAGGGQASAVLLSAMVNRLTTVATAADSVKLPPAIMGASISVFNDAAANSANVFPAVGETINALAANVAFALAAGKNVCFESAVNGKWHAILSA